MAFNGKVALVTGGASGMGRITARRLADEGALVAILDVNEEGLAETRGERENVHAYTCDVSDGEQVREVVARVETDLGAIDRVTHAAAIMPASPLMENTPEQVLRLMRVNYDGTVHITYATLPKMIERGRGDLILFGSLAGHVLAPHLGAYCATKSAVNSFAEVLIQENRGKGVRMLLVCPPLTNTPLVSQATSTSNPRSIQIGIEQGRMADPNVVIDLMERAIDRGREILFPTGEAKALYGLRRAVPRLLWKIIWAAENSKPKTKRA